MIYRLLASVKKELLLLYSDKTGLLILFVMPLLLVFIITVIQDSAYKIVNDNQIPILIVNHDKGGEGNQFVSQLRDSGLFEITEDSSLQKEELKGELLSKGKLIAVYIPENFTGGIDANAQQVSDLMMKDLGISELSENSKPVSMPDISFFYDPVMQENYSFSVMNILRSYLSKVEIGMVIEKLYGDLEAEKGAGALKDKMLTNQVGIVPVVANRDDAVKNPNSTQHNVPAWTIFAMFFMVISLGGNIVRERVNGSFLRLKTMPTSFIYVMSGKFIVYLLVAILQVLLTFTMGMTLLPQIGLPVLSLPAGFLSMLVMILLSGMAAVSYAMLIGSFAHTQEQANGFGAVTIIIFGAIGGIWVPSFMMPSFMQTIGMVSPLRWCLEGFYILFLKGGSWLELKTVMTVLCGFIVLCQSLVIYKLRLEKII